MSRFLTAISFAIALALAPSLALALPAPPLVDGSFIGDEFAYSASLSVQGTNTQFGNATNGDPQVAMSGSEIDQVFATIAGDRLYVLVTGNLESNFNKLEVFIDSTAGGVNTIDGDALPRGVDGFCCGGFPPPDGNNTNNTGALQRMHGLTFDAGFTADRYLTFSNGFEMLSTPVGDSISFWTLSAYYADLTNGLAGNIAAIGMQLNAGGQEPGLAPGEPIDQTNNSDLVFQHEFAEPPIPGTNNARGRRNFLNEIDLRMAIDNRNTAGVNGSNGPNWNATGDPQNVPTGLEFSIPLTELGNINGPIKLAAFINGGGHDYASNQFAGDGVLQRNFGGDGAGAFTGDLTGVILANVPGNQFVTVPIPEPATLALAAISLGVTSSVRRRGRPGAAQS